MICRWVKQKHWEHALCLCHGLPYSQAYCQILLGICQPNLKSGAIHYFSYLQQPGKGSIFWHSSKNRLRNNVPKFSENMFNLKPALLRHTKFWTAFWDDVRECTSENLMSVFFGAEDSASAPSWASFSHECKQFSVSSAQATSYFTAWKLLPGPGTGLCAMKEKENQCLDLQAQLSVCFCCLPSFMAVWRVSELNLVSKANPLLLRCVYYPNSNEFSRGRLQWQSY